VRRLLEAAVRAPNARNEQPWSFVIVQNRNLLQRSSDLTKALLIESSSNAASARALLKTPSFDVFYGAGTLIVICGKADNEYTEADCWLAAENLMLTAYDLGFGSCPVGSAISYLNSQREPAGAFESLIDEPRKAVSLAPCGTRRPTFSVKLIWSRREPSLKARTRPSATFFLDEPRTSHAAQCNFGLCAIAPRDRK